MTKQIICNDEKKFSLVRKINSVVNLKIVKIILGKVKTINFMKLIYSRNIINFVIISMLILILFTQSINALGVAPSRQIFSFEPNAKLSGELTIINNEGKDIRVGIYADGDIIKNVKLPQSLVDIPAGQEMTNIPYEINLPKSSTPGEHEIEIIVRQFPVDSEGGTTVSAQLAVISQILVKVSYPGKYAEGKLFISSTEDFDTPVLFTVMIYNFGKEKIEEAEVYVDIFGPTWDKVGEIKSKTISIDSKQESRVDAEWKPEVNKGTYHAVANVFYDDKSFKLEKTFDLGTFSIDILDVEVEHFKLGDVAKFDIDLYNNWNTQIDDVNVEMLIYDKQGNEMTHFESATVDIPAQNKRKIEAYWYTEGISPGIYDVKIIAHYSGKTTEKNLEFEVNINKITKLGVAGHATLSDDEEVAILNQGFIIMLIIFVVILLIIMNITWFYVLNKKLSQQKNSHSNMDNIDKKGGEK